ncbi:MAG TPA: hypothetical protein V6C58_23185 [Allocoleopsis sp.]
MSISNLAVQVSQKGQITAAGATAVVVACPSVKATSVILLSPSTTAAAGAGANYPTISAIVNNTSFSIVCAGANANVYNYVVLN